jgi:hypothetical protein
MFLYDRGVSNGFSVIAKKHYQGLIDLRILKSGKKKYYINSIIAKVDLYRTQKGKASSFFNDLYNNGYFQLERMIVGGPSELEDVIRSIESNIRSGRYPKMIKKTSSGETLTAFGIKVANVFDYSSFVKKSNRWDAYSLAEELGIDVCAYCNRNFTFTLTSGKKKIVRPEFDHFLPKSKYPYLALSFYNLIPSCHICNSNLKHAINFNLKEYLHPYISCFDDIMRFSVELKSKPSSNLIKEKKSFGLSFFYGDLNSFNLVFKERINVAGNDIDKAIKNIEVFKLKELYERHKDLVIEMVQNSIVYDDSYIDALFQKFNGTLFRSREDVLRHITKNYVAFSQIAQRPFSKLSRDIHREFGLKL